MHVYAIRNGINRQQLTHQILWVQQKRLCEMIKDMATRSEYTKIAAVPVLRECIRYVVVFSNSALQEANC